jgi:hypothetical protein
LPIGFDPLPIGFRTKSVRVDLGSIVIAPNPTSNVPNPIGGDSYPIDNDSNSIVKGALLIGAEPKTTGYDALTSGAVTLSTGFASLPIDFVPKSIDFAGPRDLSNQSDAVIPDFADWFCLFVDWFCLKSNRQNHGAKCFRRIEECFRDGDSRRRYAVDCVCQQPNRFNVTTKGEETMATSCWFSDVCRMFKSFAGLFSTECRHLPSRRLNFRR